MVSIVHGSAPDKVLFTATTGRTGTTTLVEIFNRNVPGCIAEHEPLYRPNGVYERLYYAFHFWKLGKLGKLERRGFGEVLRWYDRDAPDLARLAHLRARRIRRLGCRVYLESSHAFLSSLCDAMVSEFQDFGLIHLVRNPMEVAVSYCNRNTWSPERPEFLKALGNWHPHPESSKNCLRLPEGQLSCFQYYLWVWLESELRCLRFLRRFPGIKCFHMDTRDLNNPALIADMFAFFGILVDQERLEVPGALNRNPEITLVSDQHLAEARSLLQRFDPGILRELPNDYGLLELALQ